MIAEQSSFHDKYSFFFNKSYMLVFSNTNILQRVSNDTVEWIEWFDFCCTRRKQKTMYYCMNKISNDKNTSIHARIRRKTTAEPSTHRLSKRINNHINNINNEWWRTKKMYPVHHRCANNDYKSILYYSHQSKFLLMIVDTEQSLGNKTNKIQYWRLPTTLREIRKTKNEWIE